MTYYVGPNLFAHLVANGIPQKALEVENQSRNPEGRKPMFVKLSTLGVQDGALTATRPGIAARVADQVFEEGGSPAAQLAAAKKASDLKGRRSLSYLPHMGAKQLAKAAKRAAK